MSNEKDFFKRKEAKGTELPVHGEYQPTNFDNDLHSCGITDIKGFEERHNELFQNLIVDSDSENPVATLAQRLEEAFSSREIVFLMAKDLLQTAYVASVDNLKKKVDGK